MIALKLGGAAAASPVVDDPVTAVITEASPSEGSLLRIARDYNNDGLEDVALAWGDACGNKNCLFARFLRRGDGRYARAGEICGLPLGFRIVPLNRGRARWETCTATAEEVRYVSMIVSTTGTIEGESRALAQGEAERLCKVDRGVRVGGMPGGGASAWRDLPVEEAFLAMTAARSGRAD